MDIAVTAEFRALVVVKQSHIEAELHTFPGHQGGMALNPWSSSSSQRGPGWEMEGASQEISELIPLCS